MFLIDVPMIAAQVNDSSILLVYVFLAQLMIMTATNTHIHKNSFT